MFLFVVVQTRGDEMPWLATEASLHGNGDGCGTYISRRVTPAITLPAGLEPPLYAGGHHVRGDKGRLVYASYPPFRRWPLDDRVSCCVTAAFPAPPRTRAKASSIARLAVFGLASRCEVPTAHFALPATPFLGSHSACGQILRCQHCWQRKELEHAVGQWPSRLPLAGREGCDAACID